MPVRNDAGFLPECLASIKVQNLSNYELVAVDDGSEDCSRKVLEKAARQDPRIRIIHTPQRGIVSALNTGLSACRGRYIARMDADDRMRPQRLELQLAFLTNNPGIDFCGCRVEPFTTEGTVSENVRKYHCWSNSLLTDEEIRRERFVESPIMHPTFFASKKLFQQIGGYRDNPWPEDYDLLLRASQIGIVFGKCAETLVEKRHALDRLSRVDPIYKRPAMMKAKVHYLLESGILDHFRGVLIAGTGPTGRELAKRFMEREIPLAGFVDNRMSPPNRKVLGLPAWGFPEGVPPDFLKRFPDHLCALGIGDASGQSMMTRLLLEQGWRENLEFVRMA